MELFSDDRQSLLMRIRQLEAEVIDYRNRMPISKKERKIVRLQGKVKVISLLGEPSTESYKKGYRRIFTDLWFEVKGQFNIDTLDEIPEIHFTKAIHYINDWQPKKTLQLPKICFLCEQHPGTFAVDDSVICESCAQIMLPEDGE